MSSFFIFPVSYCFELYFGFLSLSILVVVAKDRTSNFMPNVSVNSEHSTPREKTSSLEHCSRMVTKGSFIPNVCKVEADLNPPAWGFDNEWV